MSIIEIIDWVLNYRINLYAVQAVGVFFLIVVVGEFLGKVTDDLTGMQETLVYLMAGFLYFVVCYLIGWLD